MGLKKYITQNGIGDLSLYLAIEKVYRKTGRKLSNSKKKRANEKLTMHLSRPFCYSARFSRSAKGT